MIHIIHTTQSCCISWTDTLSNWAYLVRWASKSNGTSLDNFHNYSLNGHIDKLIISQLVCLHQTEKGSAVFYLIDTSGDVYDKPKIVNLLKCFP